MKYRPLLILLLLPGLLAQAQTQAATTVSTEHATVTRPYGCSVKY